ncbi:MAG: Gfo/Idh/MocA family oxidoreductase [Chloroflexi bacterium]|nr:Gfo/Idh/MocA family oxidoreductase [Chloroflexota bacterium]
MIRVGFVGAGVINDTHASTLSRLEEVKICGVYDALPERAGAMAAVYGSRPCPDLDSLLSDVDAVFIGTPPKFHRDAVTAAAAAGVHVFCEKPLADTVEDAEAIEAAVRQSSIRMMVGFVFRFAPSFLCLKELYENGELGDVYSFWSTRLLWLPHDAPNWRTDPRFICGMTVESLSHDFDLMRWIVGDATSVFGRTATSRPDLDGYDNIMSAIMVLERGGGATFHSSWASHVNMSSHGLIGSRGTALTDRGAVRWRRDDTDSETVLTFDRPEDKISAHRREVEYFIGCLNSGETPSPGVDDGVATVRLSHAVLRSARDRTVINLA